METRLSIKNLSVRYFGSDKYALKDINVDLSSSSLVLITGASGSGKSTLAQTIMKIIPNFVSAEINGKITVNGVDLNSLSRKELIQTIGYVPQYPADYKVNLVVEDEIAFVLENLHYPLDVIQSRTREVMEQLQITHLKNRLMNELSAGELQRVALAAAFASQPPILVLDEPMARIDPKTEIKLAPMLRDLASKGTLVIVFEHHLDYLLAYADRVIVLEKGKIIKDGSNFEVLPYLKDIDLPEVSEIQIRNNKRFLTIEQAAENLVQTLQDIQRNNKNFEQYLRRERAEDHSTENNSTNPYVYFSVDSFKYRGTNVEVLANSVFRINKGAIIGLIGPNGAGKTTILRLLAGTLSSKNARISIGDKKIKGIRSTLGKVLLLPENAKLFIVGSTPLEDLAKIVGESKARDILKQCQLEHLAHKKIYELSEGQRRLIAMVNAFHTQQELLLFDEPTIGLDAKGRELFKNLLLQAKKEGKTIIISTNDNRVLVDTDEIIVVLNKKIQLQGKPAEVLYQLNQYEELSPNQIVKVIEQLEDELQTPLPHFVSTKDFNQWLAQLEVK